MPRWRRVIPSLRKRDWRCSKRAATRLMPRSPPASACPSSSPCRAASGAAGSWSSTTRAMTRRRRLRLIIERLRPGRSIVITTSSWGVKTQAALACMPPACRARSRVCFMHWNITARWTGSRCLPRRSGRRQKASPPTHNWLARCAVSRRDVRAIRRFAPPPSTTTSIWL